MKITRRQEMYEIDHKAIYEYGIPALLLMENAGMRVCEVIEDLLGDARGKNIVIIAGVGNNGGDGLVVARHMLNAGSQVTVFLLGQPEQLTPDAKTNYDILAAMRAEIIILAEEKDLEFLAISLLIAHLVVDAIYGIGFRGALNEFVSRIVNIINAGSFPVVAVDIPSGVDCDSGTVIGAAIKATHTVTFGLPKLGQLLEPGKNFVGTLSVADISFPLTLLRNENLPINLIGEDIVRPLIMPRPAESHKGSYGHAVVIGGSTGMTGAVIMTSYAALRTGAGLVTLAMPKNALTQAQAGIMEIMSVPLNSTAQGGIAVEALPEIESLLAMASVCAIGPGMSRYTQAGAIIRFVLEKAGIPLVIDADGLNALAEDVSIIKGRHIPVIITPHPGEMARLANYPLAEVQANRIAVAQEFAKTWGVITVLKGNKTLVATPDGSLYLNINGNPGMATAGSGDVLCGIIAGLLAQGLSAELAAVSGVYLHGMAGDMAAQSKGERGLIAGDIIAAIPDVLRNFETG